MQGFNFPFPVDWYFFVGLSIGAFVVALGSLQKFNEPSGPRGEGDLIRQLLPKDLTTHEEYSRAFLLYYLAPMLCLLFGIALLGPGILKLAKIDLPEVGWGAGVWPIAAALMLAGLVNVAWIKELELQLRRFAHDRAYIPERARATAERLRIADFDFSGYRRSLSAPAMNGVKQHDFDSDPETVEYAWARLSCLSYKIGRRREADGSADLDSDMLERYTPQLAEIASRRQSMLQDMDQYRGDIAAGNPAPANALVQRIDNAFRQLCLLLGCAVLLKRGRRADMSSAFHPFGFRLSAIANTEGNPNLIIVGLTIMTASILVLVFAAVIIAWQFGTGSAWTPSVDYPKMSYDPFLWAISAALSYGTAVVVADRMRARLIRGQRWFASGTADPANYIRVAVISGLAGYVVMCLWGAVLQGPAYGLFTGAAPYALLPAATGAFYAAHLDNVAFALRPARYREIGAQALVTGFCALIAAPAWLTLGRGVSGAADFIALSGVLGVAAGASLAWYIPVAAEARQNTPLKVVLSARLTKLEAIARERFRSEELARQWLHEPSSDLDNKSPLSAAEDIEAYNKVVNLLPRPSVAAAG